MDAQFRVIPAMRRSCWRGIRRPPQDDETESEEEEEEEEEEDQESEHEAEIPQPTSMDDVPLLTYPIQSMPGSSSEHPPIWDQILNNQIAMQGQLNTLNRHQEEMNSTSTSFT